VFKSIAFPVNESSQVGEARRAAHRVAEGANLGESALGSLNIIVTELGTNLHKHAKEGELIIRCLESGNRAGVEVVSIDRGPGISDVARSLEDGYSTSGTQGNGLGSVKRLSSVFDVYSTPQGTVLVSQVWNGALPEANREPETGAICLPYPGESRCGDAWSKATLGHSWAIAVMDGLGHGVDAANAAEQAITIFEENSGIAPNLALQKMHGALRATRGAAGFLLHVNLQDRKIVCSGIGNISGGTVQGESHKNFVSLNGTLGHQAHRFQEFVYEWPRSSLMFFHSDGLQTKWKLSAYPGLQVRHPSLIAAVLYRDFRRSRDDVTVLVVKDSTRGGTS
jgi:anti-sigma regulatory factor (Ser/Thr protein kinase)